MIEELEEIRSEDFTTPTPPRTDIPKARFIVNETVIHAQTGRQAQEVASHRDASFVRLLNTEEMPYRRTFSVGEEWILLDYGWAGPSPSQIIVLNEEGQFVGIPTPEKKAEVLARIVEIAVLIETYQGNEQYFPFAPVRPYESARFEPYGRLYVRCRKGTARVTICAIPGDSHEAG